MKEAASSMLKGKNKARPPASKGKKETISPTLEGKEETTPPARARNVPKIIYGKDMMELLNHKGKVNVIFGSHCHHFVGSHYHHMVSHCHRAKKYPK